MSIGYLTAYAHDSKAAFFKIEETKNAVIVEAEFPWTIRKALFEFKPEIASKKDKKELDKSFFEYVQSCFVIKDENQNVLQLTNIAADQKKGHSHQTNYIFKFEKGKVFEVTNTLMFNINEEQKNYQTIYINDKAHRFSTTINNTSFSIQEKPISRSYCWLIILIIIFGVILMFGFTSILR